MGLRQPRVTWARPGWSVFPPSADSAPLQHPAVQRVRRSSEKAPHVSRVCGKEKIRNVQPRRLWRLTLRRCSSGQEGGVTPSLTHFGRSGRRRDMSSAGAVDPLWGLKFFTESVHVLLVRGSKWWVPVFCSWTKDHVSVVSLFTCRTCCRSQEAKAKGSTSALGGLFYPRRVVRRCV